MEEQISQPVLEKEIETLQPVLPSPTTKPSYLIPVLLSSLATAALLIAGYFIFGSIKTSSSISQASPSPSPVLDQSPSPSTTTLDQASWNAYSNSVHNVSFKYPLGWQLTKEDDIAKYNASIKLTKDQATIHMIFGVDGIGGSGMDYEGSPFILDGNKVFKYKAHNTYDNSESVGITDSLKESLGVLMLSKKTYIINLKYPAKYIESGESKNLEKTFDEILSTFKFTDLKTAATSLIHYVLKDKSSSLDYPSNWEITDGTKQEDLYQDGKLQWAQSISLSYQGYKLTSDNPLAWGPGVCIFPDSSDYSKDQVYGEKYPTYVEFSNQNGIYRRVKVVGGENIKEQRWGICTKESSGGYGGVSGFGRSEYITPLQYDEKILSTMDKILMSITKKKDL